MTMSAPNCELCDTPALLEVWYGIRKPLHRAVLCQKHIDRLWDAMQPVIAAGAGDWAFNPIAGRDWTGQILPTPTPIPTPTIPPSAPPCNPFV